MFYLLWFVNPSTLFIFEIVNFCPKEIQGIESGKIEKNFWKYVFAFSTLISQRSAIFKLISDQVFPFPHFYISCTRCAALPD